MSASRPRGIELRRPWGSRTSTLVCTYGHQTRVLTDAAPSTCPVCDTETHDPLAAAVELLREPVMDDATAAHADAVADTVWQKIVAATKGKAPPDA